MKKIILVTQSKGGTGKSALTYILAQEHQEALLVDMDDASRTISNLVKDREVMHFSFFDSRKNTDRSRLHNFYEKVNEYDHNLLICDLSPAVAHQLLFHLDKKFNDIRNGLSELFAELGIVIELNIVVGGGDIFTTTMAYLKDIRQVVNQEFPIKVYKNAYFPFSGEQDRLLQEYTGEHSLEVVPFGPAGSFPVPQFTDYTSSPEIQTDKAYAVVSRTEPRCYDIYYGDTAEELFLKARPVMVVRSEFMEKFKLAQANPNQYISIVPSFVEDEENFLEILIGRTGAIRKYLSRTREEIPWLTDSIRE